MKRVVLQSSPTPPTHKKREIIFSRFPPGQVPEATDLLNGLDRLTATPQAEKCAVSVEYQLTDYTYQGLEEGLVDQGFHLDNTLFSKLMRALIHYAEETQLHNLTAAERPIKSSSAAYAQAWERHPHGDHDDTPAEWRQYR